MKTFKKFLVVLLIFIMAISIISCGNSEEGTKPVTDYEFAQVFDNGSTEFVFGVVDIDENETYFDVKTDKTNVGEALMEIGLIAGDDSEYGLYVKTVNGTTLDYDIDGKYWAFYINSEYASTAVDQTDVVEGSLYEFKAE